MAIDEGFRDADPVRERTMSPTEPPESDPETAPCFACGRETELHHDVGSPVCYRPLCEDCDDGTVDR